MQRKEKKGDKWRKLKKNRVKVDKLFSFAKSISLCLS